MLMNMTMVMAVMMFNSCSFFSSMFNDSAAGSWNNRANCRHQGVHQLVCRAMCARRVVERAVRYCASSRALGHRFVERIGGSGNSRVTERTRAVDCRRREEGDEGKRNENGKMRCASEEGSDIECIAPKFRVFLS